MIKYFVIFLLFISFDGLSQREIIDTNSIDKLAKIVINKKLNCQLISKPKYPPIIGAIALPKVNIPFFKPTKALAFSLLQTSNIIAIHTTIGAAVPIP